MVRYNKGMGQGSFVRGMDYLLGKSLKDFEYRNNLEEKEFLSTHSLIQYGDYDEYEFYWEINCNMVKNELLKIRKRKLNGISR